MHLLPSSETSLDDGADAVDLGLPPGDVLVLSFADSDLAALAAADSGGLSLRLASLRRLRHPFSVDLLIEKTVLRSRFVLVRCLGGLDYWRYGIEQLDSLCREAGTPLAVLPGDDRDDDRLGRHGTVGAKLADELLAYFRAGGGPANMGALLRRIGRQLNGGDKAAEAPVALAPLFALDRDGLPVDWRAGLVACGPVQPLVPILLYRSSVAAGDVAPAMALAEALEARGIAPLPIALTSLKDPAAAEELAALIAARRLALIVATTGFSARDGADFVLDAADCPILQGIPVGSSREAWAASARGLSGPDLAMQVALPEFDGRIGTIPIAFKREGADAGGTALRRMEPFADGIEALADLAAGWIALAAKTAAERKIALVLSDYPARGGRAGFAVGLDTPASVTAVAEALAQAGHDAGRPDGAALMASLTGAAPSDELAIPVAQYRAWLGTLPGEAAAAVAENHGSPEADAACDGELFRFRVVRSGKLLVALQPPRDGDPDRKGRYHDPSAPPCHGYLAFYLALRQVFRADALVHLGTHGNTEWLPGKAVAQSASCWPALIMRGLPVIYPYVCDDPGEAAPARRRLGAVTLGHLPPPLASAEAAGETALLRSLVEEYTQAQVLDPRRAALVGREILDRAAASGHAAASGVDFAMPVSEALSRLDAHLCDIAETQFRDGLHVFGRSEADPVSAASERRHLLAALSGRFVPPGPAGSPPRGRADVLPTGRNLSTLDPRAIPTRAAARLGRLAAEAVIARHLQEEGEPPRRVVMDLWASPTLRSGGEDIAHALALMGVEPVWDPASTRVTGFSILPLPKLAQPRADVTLRVSGAFRDLFPTQIAMMDAAARAVAALDEPDDWNEPAAARRRGEGGARIFGAAPGRFGTGVAALGLDGETADRAGLGAAYLAASDHAFGGEHGIATANPGFARRLAQADALVHVSDTPGRDILEATSAAEAIGGLDAAAASLGATPIFHSLDSSNPERPKARLLTEDIDRIVHGRITHRRWIASLLRHGWRGAAELAEAVDTLFLYAATTQAVQSAHFEAVYDALCADEAVWNRIRASNEPAASSIMSRLSEAQRRGFWTSRRNSIALLAEAAE